MRFNPSCQQAVRLLLEGEDRPLTLPERFSLRVHTTLCRACPPFVRQVRLMRKTIGRWKRYADGEG